MLASQLISSGVPVIHLNDKISFALQLMEDYDVLHLPVLEEERYLGLIDKDDLLDADPNNFIHSLEYQVIKVSVLPDEHFLSALKMSVNFGATIIPVVSNEKELIGTISQKDLLNAISTFYSQDEPGGMIILEMDKRNFSFGELSRLVETNNAFITQLNTSTDSTTGQFIVTLKINKAEISDIVATLQRYDYIIRNYFGEELYENELKENYDLLMAYLRI